MLLNNILTLRGKSILLIIILVITFIFGYVIYRNTIAESKLQQAMVLSQQQAQDTNVLQNKLDVRRQNADLLANFAKMAQAGQVQPVTHFTVQAPNVQQAAERVAYRIDHQDPTLPTAALEKTDNTIVTTEKLNNNKKDEVKKINDKNKELDKELDKPLIDEEYGVSVYKNNNYRNWEWSVGYGQHGGERYVPVELQRNFSKDAAVSFEYHFKGNKPGWEVKYTRTTDKLFYLF